MGNTIMGKGFENEANYDGCKLVFLGIGGDAVRLLLSC